MYLWYLSLAKARKHIERVLLFDIFQKLSKVMRFSINGEYSTQKQQLSFLDIFIGNIIENYAMKLSLIIVLLFTCITEVFPQNINRCGTAEYMRQQTKSNPQILLKRQELENNYLQFVNSSDQYRLSNTVITIPVVFHIIYFTGKTS